MEAIRNLPELEEKTAVFSDRTEAGRVLSGLVDFLRDSNPLLLAIPAGGVPVAAAMADHLGWPIDVAVVSKITLPWNTEAGYGAVAFDGTVVLNESLLPALGLSEAVIRRGISRTMAKVRRRVELFRGTLPYGELQGRAVVLVDDGLASGFTIRAAVAAVRKLGPEALIVAVPTGHRPALERLAGEVTTVCCANVRGGRSFAVASAYRAWRDVTEEEALAFLLGDGRS